MTDCHAEIISFADFAASQAADPNVAASTAKRYGRSAAHQRHGAGHGVSQDRPHP